MSFIITTTGSLPGGILVIPEFGDRTYTHPLVSYDLTQEFDIDEIRVSNNVRWTSNFTPPTAAYA